MYVYRHPLSCVYSTPACQAVHGLVKVLCQWGWGGGLQDPETTLWFMCLWVNVHILQWLMK